MASKTVNHPGPALDPETGIVPQGSMRIVPERSRVGFKVRKMGIYYVKGRFADVDGRIDFGGHGLPEHGEIAIRTASVKTRMPPRDWHLRTKDFLDVKRYPLITIATARVDPTDDGFIVRAGFEVHGQQRAVDLHGHLHAPGRANGSAGAVIAHLHGTVDRYDFGIRPRPPFDMVVGREVHVDAELALERIP